MVVIFPRKHVFDCRLNLIYSAETVISPQQTLGFGFSFFKLEKMSIIYIQITTERLNLTVKFQGNTMYHQQWISPS